MAPTKQLVTISASNDILVITFRFESQIEELTEPLREPVRDVKRLAAGMELLVERWKWKKQHSIDRNGTYI